MLVFEQHCLVQRYSIGKIHTLYNYCHTKRIKARKKTNKNEGHTHILENIFHLQRVHLDIQVGEHAIDYANVAQKEKLSELQLRIRQLLDQVGQITKEQNYQRV